MCLKAREHWPRSASLRIFRHKRAEFKCRRSNINQRDSSKSQLDEYDPELTHNGYMVTMDTLRAERREEILRLAERRGAHSLRVFGSVARGEANDPAISICW